MNEAAVAKGTGRRQETQRESRNVLHATRTSARVCVWREQSIGGQPGGPGWTVDTGEMRGWSWSVLKDQLDYLLVDRCTALPFWST
jgi:hypothetical protein